MRTYKGEIEHSNQKVEESKLKRFAFNSMKRAKEGLMIVTFSVALVTGFTNNVYGDENMTHAQKEENINKNDIKNKNMGEINKITVALLKVMEGASDTEVTKHIESIKKIFPNGDKLIEGIENNPTIIKMIEKGELTTEELYEYTAPNIFSNQDVQKLDLTDKKDQKAISYLLLANIATYNEESKLLNLQFEKNDYNLALEQLHSNLFSDSINEDLEYRVTVLMPKKEGSKIDTRQASKPGTVNLGEEDLNADGNTVFGEYAERDENGKYYVPGENINDIQSNVREHYTEMGVLQSEIEKIEKNPGKVTEIISEINERLTTEEDSEGNSMGNLGLGEEQQKTLEIYAKMIENLPKMFNKAELGGMLLIGTSIPIGKVNGVSIYVDGEFSGGPKRDFEKNKKTTPEISSRFGVTFKKDKTSISMGASYLTDIFNTHDVGPYVSVKVGNFNVEAHNTFYMNEKGTRTGFSVGGSTSYGIIDEYLRVGVGFDYSERGPKGYNPSLSLRTEIPLTKEINLNISTNIGPAFYNINEFDMWFVNLKGEASLNIIWNPEKIPFYFGIGASFIGEYNPEGWSWQ